MSQRELRRVEVFARVKTKELQVVDAANLMGVIYRRGKRLKIGTHEQTNEYLQRKYLPEHNRRFRRVEAEPQDYHRRVPNAAQLREVFRLESERTVSND